MKALFKGITDLFKVTNAFNTSIGGRFHLYEAPEREKFPYCVYFIANNRAEYTFTTKFEYINLQFSIFSNTVSSSQITTAYNNLIALFDDAVLTVAGFKFVSMIRENDNLFLETDPKRVWHSAVLYNILIEHN